MIKKGWRKRTNQLLSCVKFRFNWHHLVHVTLEDTFYSRLSSRLKTEKQRWVGYEYWNVTCWGQPSASQHKSISPFQVLFFLKP